MDVKDRCILVVDDEIFIRQSFIDFFEDRLWRAIEAESGEQALEILDHETPLGAIVDIRLGGMDGNTFIRKACQKNPGLAFVICTGSPEYDVPPDLRDLPGVAQQIFRKPVTDIGRLEQALLGKITDMNTAQD